MTIYFRNNRFEAKTEYEERHTIKKYGWRWDPTKKVWYTYNDTTLDDLAKESGVEVDGSVNEKLQKKAALVELSKATDVDIDIPLPAGLELYGYQCAGVAYALKHKHTIIADEMGLGKTVQAIGVCNATKAKKVLIVCPSFLKDNWAREYKKWSTEKNIVEIASGKKIYMLESDVIIINYDILSAWVDVLAGIDWDVVVFDEAHYLKNHKAKRTQAALKLAGKKVLYLTGTPVLNRPIELYTMLKNAGLNVAKSWYTYVKRYCDGRQTRWGWDVNGASNTDELNTILREKIMVRRLKSDVLKELPAKTRQVVVLEKDKKLVAEQAKVYEHMLGLKGKDYQVSFGKIANMRKQLGLSKVDTIVEWALNTIENNGCAVIMVYHKEVAEKVAEALAGKDIKTAVITGDTKDRQQIVDDFQNGKTDAIIGTIGAMGVGLTLTRASVAIMGELDWTPANLEQAEDRLHRIGQENNVQIIYLVHENSIDEKIVKMLEDKKQTINEVTA